MSTPPAVVVPSGGGPLTIQQVAVASALAALLAVGIVRALMVIKRVPQHCRVPQPAGYIFVVCGACRKEQYAPTIHKVFTCCKCEVINLLPPGVRGKVRKVFLLKKNEDGSLYEIARKQTVSSEEELAMAEREARRRRPVASPAGTAAVVGAAASVEPPEPGDASFPDCAICCDGPGRCVLLPCAHGGMCRSCVMAITMSQTLGGACCPTCRGEIESVVVLEDFEGDELVGEELIMARLGGGDGSASVADRISEIVAAATPGFNV